MAMKISSRKWWYAIPLLLAVVGPALAQTPQGEPTEVGDEYRQGDYGRVRDAESGLTIVRAEWDHERGVSDQGTVNSPIFPGDSVSTATGQRVEVQLANGTLVWIDDRTELDFLALPDPYADFADHAVLRLREGAIRLATSLADNEEFRIDTPSASIYPLGDADVRIEVDGGGWTRVLSRTGVVEVVGQGGSVLLRAGTRTAIEPGALPIDPESFNTFTDDGFDRWVEARKDAYAYGKQVAEAPGVYQELPDEVQPYYRELSASGTWTHVDDYGYVWQPVGVGTDWKPYYDGYWGYGPNGYFWISNERWGWAPYHYGRWSWIGGYGWCWSPGTVFGGAWVSWSWGSAYVGWSPLNYWNYPAYHSSWHYGYYDPYCWTFLSYRHFGYRHYSHYSVGWDHVRHDLHGSAVVTRPPRYSPGQLASSADARRRAHYEAQNTARYRLAPSDRGELGRRSFRSDEYRSAPPAAQARRPPAKRGGTYSRPVGGQRDRVPVVTEPRYPRQITRVKPLSSRPSPTHRTRTGYERSPGEAREQKPSGSGRLHDVYRKMARPRQTREQPTASRPSPRSTAPRARPDSAKRPTARTTPRPRTPTARPKPAKRTAPRTTPRSRTPTARPKPAKRTAPRATPKSRTPTARPKPAKRPPSKSTSSRTYSARPRPKSARSGSRSPASRPSAGKKRGGRR
jgi:hypothetical protein